MRRKALKVGGAWAIKEALRRLSHDVQPQAGRAGITLGTRVNGFWTAGKHLWRI